MLSLILVVVMVPALAESCSASQHHPHFLRRNPPLFTLTKNSTKTEKLCAIQLRGECAVSKGNNAKVLFQDVTAYHAKLLT